MNKFILKIKDYVIKITNNKVIPIKNNIVSFFKKSSIFNIIDLTYFSQNKRVLIARTVAFLLLGVILISASLFRTADSAAVDALNSNADCVKDQNTSNVVTLINEVEKNELEIENNKIDEALLKEVEAKEKAEAEAKAKAEAEKKRKEQEAKGIYTAPPTTASAGFVEYKVPLSREWQIYTYNLCQEYGVSYEVMLGLMYAESSFNFNASSGVAHGICQIHYCHESYAKSIGIDNYKEPAGNILLGVKFMSGNLKSQNGDYHKALICYNYGSGGAQKHCFSKGIYQTSYSKKVMKYANNLVPA